MLEAPKGFIPWAGADGFEAVINVRAIDCVQSVDSMSEVYREALREIRAMREQKREVLPPGGVVVYVRGGLEYYFKCSLVQFAAKMTEALAE